VTSDDVKTVACPVCRGPLTFDGTFSGGELARGRLQCRGCTRDWSVQDGLAHLFDEAQVRGLDRFMRFLYDHLAILHDPAVRFLLPLLQGSSEQALRDAYMSRLCLQRLRPPASGQPLRILEVGVGAGANLPLLERDLPKDLHVELWGVDLSFGMMEQCRGRLAQHSGRRVRLLMADAHALPFADASFDRVFHVGGIAGYRDPRRGLAEMARVARPGTPIVVVDEQLDRHRAHGFYERLAFRTLTFYDSAPAAPIAHLPAGATDVDEEQVSRFYYCLSFRVPKTARTRRARPARRARPERRVATSIQNPT